MGRVLPSFCQPACSSSHGSVLRQRVKWNGARKGAFRCCALNRCPVAMFPDIGLHDVFGAAVLLIPP